MGRNGKERKGKEREKEREEGEAEAEDRQMINSGRRCRADSQSNGTDSMVKLSQSGFLPYSVWDNDSAPIS